MSDWNSFKSVKHLFLSVITWWPMPISSPGLLLLTSVSLISMYLSLLTSLCRQSRLKMYFFVDSHTYCMIFKKTCVKELKSCCVLCHRRKNYVNYHSVFASKNIGLLNSEGTDVWHFFKGMQKITIWCCKLF